MVLLFNIGGYNIFFLVLRYQVNQEISNRLEANQYERDEMISLKIPLALPYLTEEEDYRPATGEVEYQGEFYKLIKQKKENNALIIVCIKNHQEKHLVKKMMDYANLSNDLPAQSKQNQNLLNKLVQEYEAFYQIEITSNKGWIMSRPYVVSLSYTETFDISIQAPPPKLFL